MSTIVDSQDPVHTVDIVLQSLSFFFVKVAQFGVAFGWSCPKKWPKINGFHWGSYNPCKWSYFPLLTNGFGDYLAQAIVHFWLNR